MVNNQSKTQHGTNPAEPQFQPQLTYTDSPAIKFVFFGLATLLFIITYILGDKTNMSFNALFYDDLPVEYIFLFFGFIFLVVGYYFGSEHREAKLLIDNDGNPNVITPRSYVRLKATPLAKFFGGGDPFGADGLADFYYDGKGNVWIKGTKNNVVSGPLSAMTFKYKVKENPLTGAYYICSGKVTDPQGNSVTLNRNTALFENNEWDDMFLLLSFSGNVIDIKDKGALKVLHMSDNILKQYDFDIVADDPVDDAQPGMAGNGANRYAPANNLASKLVKLKIIDYDFVRVRAKIWEKLGLFVILTVLCIYFITVLVANLSGSSSAKEELSTDDSSEYTAQSDKEKSQQQSVEVTDEEKQEDFDDIDQVALPFYNLELKGTIDGKYPVEMSVDLDKNEGEYRYLNVDGGMLSLDITKFNRETYDIIMVEYNEDGERTGVFEGVVDFNDRVMSGAFTNSKDQKMPFELNIINMY